MIYENGNYGLIPAGISLILLPFRSVIDLLIRWITTMALSVRRVKSARAEGLLCCLTEAWRSLLNEMFRRVFFVIKSRADRKRIWNPADLSH